ncbi:MAG: SDR family oxidoreductase [Alphaproteobacteria bacterium]|nr:SDR family oxidoreductase [Candidatus Parcubacteria bacterium]NCQ67530.1 SDR family oxidoreductase [Alphaproteobacteria bacterium]
MIKNLFNLSKKHIVVTGANGILGKVFCEGLLEYGATLSLIDLNFDYEWVNKLKKINDDSVVFYPFDITSAGQLDELVGNVESKHGKVDVLFSNAATKGRKTDAFFSPYEDYTTETWREIMSVNMDSMFYLTQAFGKKMADRHNGSIILTGSIYGLLAPDQRIYEGSLYEGRHINSPAVYTVSKAGVVGLMKYLASYWGDKNVRVNALIPGGIESGQNDVFKKNYGKRTPLGRMGKPEELIGALVYLASDASTYYTGQTLVVDGGLSVW